MAVFANGLNLFPGEFDSEFFHFLRNRIKQYRQVGYTYVKVIIDSHYRRGSRRRCILGAWEKAGQEKQ